MMSHQDPPQGKLFYMGINLEKRIRKNHPLRKIKELIDFDFIYNEVKDKYGYNGNESVPPPVILKLMLLLVFYNVRSERELMETVEERLDWLWFLDYDLDTEVPNHSVLSKARKRWGVEAFRNFYERILWQCVKAGLVDGSKIFVDSSLVDADASNNSVVDTQSLNRYLNKSYMELEKRLEEKEDKSNDNDDDNNDSSTGSGINKRYVSTTDPDASITRTGGKPRLRYQTHRVVDGAYEVITATDVTSGDVNEAHKMTGLIESSELNTETRVDTVVADGKYGTIRNYLECYDRGIKAHIPDLNGIQSSGERRRGIYPDSMFVYDEGTDTYTCPAGKKLKRRSLHIKRQSMDYAASKSDCNVCELKPKCTKNKTGRTVKRHLRQSELDYMRGMANTRSSRKDIRTRQHLMERSFARSVRYGHGRARWRGLWRVKIQEYLISAVQNLLLLIKHGINPGKAVAKRSSIKDNTARVYKIFTGISQIPVQKLRIQLQLT